MALPHYLWLSQNERRPKLTRRAIAIWRSAGVIPRSPPEADGMLSWRGFVGGTSVAGGFLMLLFLGIMGSSSELLLKPRSVSS
jgi:hypothetical protein